MAWLILAIAVAVLLWSAAQIVRLWWETGDRQMACPARIRLALLAVVAPERAWWDHRLRLMPETERRQLLADLSMRWNQPAPETLRCPLCGAADLEQVWIMREGRLAVARREAVCPSCGFRLDCCRHCVHFLPGEGNTSGFGISSLIGGGDIGSGRCGHYKTWRSVREVCPPDMARRLEERGMERVRSPMPIADSYLPPESCTAFQLEERRLRQNDVPPPDRRQRRLLRLMASLQQEDAREGSAGEPSEEEQWLM